MLVVVPQASIIGARRWNDNGDGAPDTLDRGVPVETARVPVDPLLADDLTQRVAPLLRALDRRGRRYDLTTDLALARGQGAPLRGHSGVVLAGTTRYIDRRLQTQLVAWVPPRRPPLGRGTGSLLRSITTTPTQATRPTQPARLDPFGFELGEPLRLRGISLLTDPCGSGAVPMVASMARLPLSRSSGCPVGRCAVRSPPPPMADRWSTPPPGLAGAS